MKAWAVLRKLKKEEDDFLGRERGCEQGVEAEVLEVHSGDPKGHAEEQGSSVRVFCPQRGVSLVSDWAGKGLIRLHCCYPVIGIITRAQSIAEKLASPGTLAHLP